MLLCHHLAAINLVLERILLIACLTTLGSLYLCLLLWSALACWIAIVWLFRPKFLMIDLLQICCPWKLQVSLSQALIESSGADPRLNLVFQRVSEGIDLSFSIVLVRAAVFALNSCKTFLTFAQKALTCDSDLVWALKCQPRLLILDWCFLFCRHFCSRTFVCESLNPTVIRTV